MGLMDFAKNIGMSLFNREEEAAEKIREHLMANNPGLEDLQIRVEDGVATITCKAADRAAAEKAILMIGNVRGVKQVNYDIQTKENQKVEVANEVVESNDAKNSDSKKLSDVQFYDIQSGDTLSAIAKKFYGNANAYQKIFEANREVIVNPDKIFPGQRIRIPEQAQP